jgi:hypothetical protein
MMESVLEQFRPEPRWKMWQNLNFVGIVNKEVVPIGLTVNEKFYCDFVKRFSQHI